MPERALTITALMTSNMAEAAGFVHGSRPMHLLDDVAYACASTDSRSSIVAASVNVLSIKTPMRVGDLLTVCAEIERTRRASMVASPRVDARHIRISNHRFASSSSFRMVALDDHWRLRPVPQQLVPAAGASTPAGQLATRETPP